MIRILLIGGVLLLAFATTEAAQTKAKPSAPATSRSKPTTNAGGYATLSPDNQKIADALFQAQKTSATGTMGMTGYTRDQIAAMKQGGQGWGQVFQQMKAQGLVREKSLGQVVSRYSQTAKSSSSRPAIATTASGKGTVRH